MTSPARSRSTRRRRRSSAPHEHTVALGEILTALGFVVGLTASLMVYFGWSRNQAIANQLGISESLFNRSAQDYVIRSASAILRQALGLSAAAVLGTASYVGLLFLRDFSRWASIVHRLILATRVTTVLVAIVLGLGWASITSWITVSPNALLTIALLFLLTELISMSPRSHRATSQSRENTRLQPTARQQLLLVATALLLVTVGAFAKTVELATADGYRQASELAADPTKVTTSVVVYTDKDLAIYGPGVTQQALDGSQSLYRVRYDGLLLYQFNDSRYFLIPSGWRGDGPGPWNMPLIVLAATGGLRVQVNGAQAP